MFKNHINSILLSGSILLGLTPLATHAASDDPKDRLVVMISVDGLASFYFDDPKAEMPTLRKLAAEGARSTMMKASTPTVTWPNHTTLVTGVNPAKHGVTGNNCFDRAANQRLTFIGDPVFDKDQIVKVPTLYDLAKAEGLKTAAIRWPASRNAKSLDWTVPDMKAESSVTNYCTAALLDECEAADIHLREAYEKKALSDALATSAFNLILRKNHPNFALLHVANVDHAQHEKGPRTPEAYEAVKAADEQVRLVWEEMQKDYPGKATLIVVSDHGFSPITHTILPNVTLRQAGLVKIEGKETTGSVQVVIQGGSAMFYILDQAHRAEIITKVARAFAGAEGVSKVVGPEQLKDYGVANPAEDPHAPDMILFAEEGCAFGNTANGEQPFKDKVELTGTHGHDPNLPHLHATFVACGYGIKPGVVMGEIANTCVAPTVAQLLHVKLPDTDGIVLKDILAQ